ncbi:MAG: hypothetical protein WD294_15600 [Phycisphaeraceae bacterium]
MKNFSQNDPPGKESHTKPLASLPKDQQADGDAILYSVGANADHGLRRTNADKRASVETLLADDEWAKWSDNKIAKACGVSPTTVGTARSSLSNLDSEPRTYTDRHGNTSTMNTSNIGRRKVTSVSDNAPPDDSPTIDDQIGGGRRYGWPSVDPFGGRDDG